MNNNLENKEKILTKKDHTKTALKCSFIGSNNINYGTLQGTGYAWAIHDALRKIYPDDDEFIKAMDVEYEYFNSTPYVIPLIMGADVAMQEQKKSDSLEAVRSIKTSLMGPLAGVGDSILWVLYPTIMGSIGGYLALEGNPLGAIIWIILNCFLVLMRLKFYKLGYNSGTRLVTDLSKKLNVFTDAASVMGLSVVGSLIATAIKVYTSVEFKFGDVTMNLQEQIFDAVLPSLLPVLLVGLVYWLMEKKKIGFLGIIIGIIIVCLVCSYFNILSVAP
ncbi:PTS system mannose/fructose/sorbose family transporter subunit IID [Anaerococcus sp. AGMB00486]|uniref:PTS system mannose/fructose/sorbose family transporter subunit IID n=2 Tax=Anaerococcus TaxID=165779 RepID=A0ABX2NC24_9FIRM|nr:MULTISPECIES: PTS system mannose/fructose/sorbose family transporter subunit IID [Anaerococcus]MSS77828.1 PTS system mannose/fructose/sorbose family transporter subunit IID [Anaerococcus porci]NVF12262.1 PTS system mannose/fructose/sorbose family transporter subunit IID [Anaerococcus faecalis]